MRPAVLPLALCVLGAVAGRLGASFELLLDPVVPVVEFGGSIQLKLKTTCRDPQGKGNVETSFRKKLLNSTPTETVVELLNITEWGSTIIYFYNCGRERKTVSTKLVVYNALQPVVLEPLGELEVGKSHEVTCRVDDVAPIQNLTVTLTLGNETLGTKTFETDKGDAPVKVRVTQLVTAQRWHHGQSITCHTVLDLAPYGPRLQNSSKPQTLAVYEFPEDPRLESPTHLEVNEMVNISCGVGRVFPAPRFQLVFANQSLAASVSHDGHQATAVLGHNQPGVFTLGCTVKVGPKERRKEALVSIYRFPGPWLNISSATPAAGTTVTGVCSLPAGHSAELQLQVQAGHHVLAGWAPSPLTFNLTVHESYDGMKVTCYARMPVGGKSQNKSRTIQLSVPAKPRLDDQSCPPRQNWTEGQEETLRCWAWGNPRPRLVCSKAGEAFPVNVPRPVTRASAGTYHCLASNPLGAAERNITVWVQYHDPEVLLPVLLALALVVALVAGGVTYSIYYRKKKVRQYRLQQKQQEMKRLRPPGGSEKTAATNGSARDAQP
ncbi:intercellular adhesion molecule 1-like isoform X2 [Phaenicophaeus curvirostris]|uniref:intercellular adhesion molecule 1-like isoform X2 n=1 Tax=Phaenicophaeus curvirostris TaxID=33595 RepID=UPI0037F0A690